MGILRAGPFSDGTSHFLQSQSDTAGPVNCANYTDSNVWLWQYKKSVTKLKTTHTGCRPNEEGENVPVLVSSQTENLNSLQTVNGNFSVNDSISSNNINSMSLFFSFFYQATHNFNIQIDFAASNPNAAFQTDPQLFIDSTMTTPIETWPNLSGSVTRTLPATVIPSIYSLEIAAAGGINVSSNPCSPSTTIVTSAVSLNFQFL
jgi:hypothetical protein